MERVVKITVAAQVNSYLAGMDLVARKTREGRTEAEQLTAKLEAQRKAINFAGSAMLAGGGLLAAGLALATAKAAEFDEAMSHVQAATHESAENMSALRDAAIEAGARTVYSATEAANAIEELAKAGISTADILNGGLDGALDLAAAGSLDVAQAAGIAATAMTQFKLAGDQTSHVADLLAAGAGKAMGDVTDLAQALNQGGLVANQFGLSIEETTGVLAAFASNGLLGSDAGTSFKTMLQRLVPQSKQAQEWMDALGLSAFDASGQFIGMTNYAGKLHDALSDMSDEQRNTTLSVLFGSDAVRAASVIYDQGADGIQGWIDAVDDQGYAAETAALKLDNLKGDLEGLGGAFDSLLISVGETGQGPLRAIVQGLTDLINVFNDMPEGGKQAVFWVGAVASAALLAGGTFLLAVPKIAAYKIAIAELGPAAQRASRGLAAVGKAAGALAVVGLAVAGVDQLGDDLRNRLAPTVSELQNALETATSAKDLFDKAITRENLQAAGEIEPIIKNVQELHDVLKTASHEGDNLWDWLNANTAFTAQGAQFNEFRERWQALAKEMASSPDTIGPAFQRIRDEYNLSSAELSRLIQLSPELTATLNDQAGAAGLSATDQNRLAVALGGSKDATKENEKALRSLAGQAGDTGDEVDKLSDQIQGFGSAQVDLEEASSNFKDALVAAKQSLKDNGENLDLNTKKGRLNLAALRDIHQATLDKASATKAATGSDEEAAKVIEQGRVALIKTRIAMGDSKAAAEAYANKLGLIPENVYTAAKLSTAQADRQMIDWRDKWKDFKIKLQVGGGGARMESRASGGILPGAPSSTDNMLAAVASGEFIVRASQVAIPENRRALEYMNAGGRMRGYQDGGFVQPQYASPVSSAAFAVPPAMGPVYVQNPFTGEYLLSQVDKRADGRIKHHDAVNDRVLYAGRRVRY